MNKSIIVLALLILGAGCDDASKTNKLKIGMTKDEVIKVMGSPSSTSATGNWEYLTYKLTDDAFRGIIKPYYVRLINGYVDSYGALGDFDSTKTPEMKIRTEENIHAEINSR